jgi:SAM-dependent methyltransferase
MLFRDSAFGAVVSTALLEHVEDPDLVVKEFNRLLAPEGVLFLSGPFLFGEHGRDFRRWTRYGLQRWLEAYGFHILELRELGGIFTVLATILARIMLQILSPGVNRDNWRIRRNWPRYALHLAFQVLLAPFMYVLMAFDLLDRQKNFTVGYAVVACKRGPGPISTLK